MDQLFFCLGHTGELAAVPSSDIFATAAQPDSLRVKILLLLIGEVPAIRFCESWTRWQARGTLSLAARLAHALTQCWKLQGCLLKPCLHHRSRNIEYLLRRWRALHQVPIIQLEAFATDHHCDFHEA